LVHKKALEYFLFLKKSGIYPLPGRERARVRVETPEN
jgi:hypothetical protein